MFIISKRGFKFRFPDGSFYRVDRDFVGDVPGRVAEHPLFKAAVSGGEIMTPDTHKDADIYRAEENAVKAAERADIRPDAVKPGKDTVEDEKPVKRAKKRLKT